MYYKKLEEGIEKCNLCQLKKIVETNSKYGPMYGYGGDSVIICGLAPSYKRADNSKYTLSRDHKKGTAGTLFEALDEAKWPIEKTYFTNILKCSTPENRLPNENEVDICFSTWFSQELFLVNPFAIVAMGKYVEEYLNSVLKDSIPIFGINHFAYISRNRSKYGEWTKEWKETGCQIKNIIDKNS